MRKLLACLLLAALLCAPACAEKTLIDKVNNPDADFAFAQDAQLLEVYFANVYGCDAAFVRQGEYTMLIDSATSDQAPRVRAMLDALGVKKLTYAMNSHPDNDHISGFFTILPDIPADEYLTGFPASTREEPLQEKMIKKLESLGIPARRVENGETFAFGDAQVTVIQHYDEKVPGINNNSAMLKFTFGERSVLFTGDVQKVAQLAIIEDKSVDLSAEVLKFPHHGYDRMQKGFLERVSPEVVVFTAGYDKKSRALEQIRDFKMLPIYTYKGILRFTTDGETWVMERLP